MCIRDRPTTSYGDITRYFAEQGILFHGKELIRPTLAQMLRNPVYVQADLDAVSYTHLDRVTMITPVLLIGIRPCRPHR